MCYVAGIQLSPELKSTTFLRNTREGLSVPGGFAWMTGFRPCGISLGDEGSFLWFEGSIYLLHEDDSHDDGGAAQNSVVKSYDTQWHSTYDGGTGQNWAEVSTASMTNHIHHDDTSCTAASLTQMISDDGA